MRKWVICAVLAAAAIVPAASAVRRYRAERFRARLAAAFEQGRRGDDGIVFPLAPDGDSAEVEDDASARRLAMLAWAGPRGPAFHRDLMMQARGEALRFPDLVPGAAFSRFLSAPSLFAPVSGLAWANLGPTASNFEWNGSGYTAQDTGRPNSIRVDPRDANVVYVAMSGGGIWKSYDFSSATPGWIPITETLGNLAIGAMDEQNDTLWVGLGDFVDTAGGQLVRSTDGGASWSAPITLSGTYPVGPLGGAVTASNVRDLRIDPNNPDIVLAGTDVGLFRSTNATSAAPTFALVNLPNSGSNVQESVWTIVPTGTSRWALSGVYACDTASPPPLAGGGLPAGTSCSGGNLGDVWTSSDGGATWTSARAAGKLPAPGGVDVGRIALGSAGLTVYAEASNVDEGGGGATNVTAGILKSTDGGVSWTTLATQSTAPSNPTTSSDCKTLNLGHDQSWYNFAVAVDPANPAHAVFGGNLCGARTTNGGTSFDLVAHWLPSGGGGNVSGGALPYLHADWHAAIIANGVAYVGSDGGIFASSNLFTATPVTVSWRQPDVGIVAHLTYSVASGDAVDGNSFVAFSGLQDNGTRFRDAVSDPTVFNQVIGGDGIGTAANNNGSSGTTNEIYWSSNPGGPRSFCKPATTNCNVGGNWSSSTIPFPKHGNTDSEPFLIHVSAVLGDANSSVITHTNQNVWRTTFSGAATWTRLTPAGFTNNVIRNVHAAPQVFTVGGASKRLYGLALSGGMFAIGQDSVPLGATVSFTMSATSVGSGTGAAGVFERYTTSIAFPCIASGSNCTNNGQTYLAATAAPVLSDGVSPVPASMGHLFKTTNNGTTWTAFHGTGLPNVPIEVIRFDPGDNTDQTLYAGTDLGIYRSLDGGATWARFGSGMPMVRVSDLFISKNGGMLRAGTYGRGLWEIFPGASNPHGVPGDGDFDRNLAIDFLDLGALSSRLGTTPSSASYDWNLDLTGTVNAIDESDLSALLAKFGSRP